jgi:hypothetical protein
MSVGDLVIGWLLLRQAEVALAALAMAPGSLPAIAGSVSKRDAAFYEGKIAAARWFAANVLPELAARRSMLEATDLGLIDLPEEAF